VAADHSTGRFPQVSNIRFTFDASKPPGQRIVEVEVCGAPLDRERVYTMATRGYMGRGKDGYDSLLVQPEGGKCEEVVSEENGMLISAMLRQYFMSLKVMGQWTGWGPSLARHWSRVAEDVGKSHPNIESPVSSPVHEKGQHGGWLAPSRPGMPLRKQSWAVWTPEKLREMRGNVEPLNESGDEDDDEDSSDGESSEAQAEVRSIDRELEVMRRVFHKWCRLAGVRGEACDSLSVAEIACGWAKAIAPRVEGRIRIIGVKK
jgi:5'-nucleotidase